MTWDITSLDRLSPSAILQNLPHATSLTSRTDGYDSTSSRSTREAHSTPAVSAGPAVFQMGVTMARAKDPAARITVQSDGLHAVGMRRMATGCVAAAASLYVGLGFAPPVWPVLAARAAAEAALIGGIADWFAVVALFRHPLHLPIPRTGIITRNKDRIAVAIGYFVQTHLLDPEEVVKRTELGDLSAGIAEWLQRDLNARMVAKELVTTLPVWLTLVDHVGLKDKLKAAVRQLIAEIDLLSTADEALGGLLERGEHFVITDAVAVVALEWLQAQRPRIEARINKHASRYAASYLRGSILDVIGVDPDQVAGRLISTKDVRDITAGVLREISHYLVQAQQPGTEVREALDALIRDRLEGLRTSKPWASKLESLRAEFLNPVEFDRRFETVWTGLWAQLVEATRSSTDATVAELAKNLKSMASAIVANDDLRATVDEHLRNAVRNAIANYRSQAGCFVVDIIRSWSSETLSLIVEQNVGEDLQFVRINGTLVGALVGLLIFALNSVNPLV